MRISQASIMQICNKSNISATNSSGEAAHLHLAGYAVLQSDFAGMGVPAGRFPAYYALHRKATTA
jgi:hypothetical protein